MSVTTGWGKTARAVAAAVMLVAVALTTSAWGADGVRVEGEDYNLYGSHNIGGYPISTEYCGSASQYFAADGIDLPGEWIMLEVMVEETGCYDVTVAYQSYFQNAVGLRLRVVDYPEPGQSVVSDFTLTEGYGFG
jgi:hypothetical protein